MKQLVILSGKGGAGKTTVAAALAHLASGGLSLVLADADKADLNPARADEIAAFCVARGIGIAGRIPYDDLVTEAMVQGRPVTEYADGPVTEALWGVWMRVRERLFPDGAGGRR